MPGRPLRDYRHARVSVVKFPRRRAASHVARGFVGAADEIHRRIGDAKPEFLADEVMTQVILLEPAADARARLIGHMRDVVHPLVLEDRQCHTEHGTSDSGPTKNQRKAERRYGEIGDQKPDRQEQEIEPLRLGVMIVMQPMLQFAYKRKPRRFGVERETVKTVFADVKRQRAEPSRFPFVRKLQHRLHYDHHTEPERLDLLFLPVWFLIPNLAITALGFALIFGRATVASAMFGVTLAIFQYEWVHYVAHVPYQPRTRVGRWLKQYHLRHHFISEKFWFGVSNPSMDFIGRTYKAARDVTCSATTRKLYD